MPRGGQVYRHEEFRKPGGRTSLVASSRIYESGAPGIQSLRKNGHKSKSDSWQNDLWDMYDVEPSFRAACTWVGNLLSKAVLEVWQNGEPTTNQHALDALASLFGGIEGQEEMLRLLGINFTVAGEAWIVGTPTKDYDEWTVVASVEVTGETNKDLKVEGDPVPPGTLGVRLWKAHPRKSWESDCNARALLNTLGQAVRLAQVVNAMADSRLKGNGILFVPSELEMPSIPVTTEVDGEELTAMQAMSTSQGITQMLIKIASIAMQNRDSAAANIPLVIAAPGEYLEKVNWIDFWTGFDEHVQSLREEARNSIAIGMDMPPEALTGTADVNHWGSWQIEEAAIKVHTEPLLAVIVASLTTGYLRPYLRDSGVADWETFSFEANTAALRLRPNRSKEAIELYDRGALSIEALLVENGFDPKSDAPDTREQMMFFLRQIATKTSATPDQLAAALERLGVSGMPTGEDPKAALDTRSLEGHPVREIPQPEDSEAAGAQASGGWAAPSPAYHQPVGSAVVIDGLVLACEAHIMRALERAGNRLKAKVGPIDAEACDYYMSIPTLDYAECEALLEDAWTRLDRFDYPGISTARLRDALHEYALMLLRSQKPMTRSSLAKHLVLEMNEAA